MRVSRLQYEAALSVARAAYKCVKCGMPEDESQDLLHLATFGVQVMIFRNTLTTEEDFIKFWSEEPALEIEEDK